MASCPKCGKPRVKKASGKPLSCKRCGVIRPLVVQSDEVDRFNDELDAMVEKVRAYR